MKASEQQVAKRVADHALMIARQPIYNHQMGVFGYELLFRPSGNNVGDVTAAGATAHVLTSAILSAGLEQLVYNRKAVINVTRAFLDVMPQVQLPAEQLVLDIPDNISVDDALLDSLNNLKELGYGLSVGGFGSLRDQRLLSIADDYRVDVHKVPVDQLDRLTDHLRSFKNLSLRALKIQTLDEYDTYQQRGYDYFQGYFLGCPRTHEVRDLSPNRIAIMEVLAAVHNIEASIEDLEEKIVRDVSLSFKLLRLINSPFFGVPNKVDSIKRAVVLLGRSEIRNLVSLLALSGSADQPRAMIEIALLRAKTCEILGRHANVSPEGLFTVGMFSALDILMKQPIQKVLARLPLSDDIRGAILDREGVMGEALNCALAIEKAQWSAIQFSDLDEDDLFGVSVEALGWTNGVIDQL